MRRIVLIAVAALAMACSGESTSPGTTDLSLLDAGAFGRRAFAGAIPIQQDHVDVSAHIDTVEAHAYQTTAAEKSL